MTCGSHWGADPENANVRLLADISDSLSSLEDKMDELIEAIKKAQ